MLRISYILVLGKLLLFYPNMGIINLAKEYQSN